MRVFSYTMPIKYLFAFILIWICSSCSFQSSRAGADQVCFQENCFQVEVARKPTELQRGLQFRESLDESAGMLFIFPEEGVYLFWMKDTLIFLDMIWLNEKKEIIYIKQNVPPCVKNPCPTYGPRAASRYVLEVKGGVTEALGIKEGQHATFLLRNE